ncbi:hypothetical protein [Amycolatopsis sp. FDAARGOS 1241]|nr:hypothetical protein [Amycolatopsis sp. FDAARGOS 1241]QRP45106.1 hypothetical protein I6J71_38950 [Amycolatopsis sp. FDAARGOS 1241]
MFHERPHLHLGDGGFVSGWVVAVGFALAFVLVVVGVVVSLRRKRRK